MRSLRSAPSSLRTPAAICLVEGRVSAWALMSRCRAENGGCCGQDSGGFTVYESLHRAPALHRFPRVAIGARHRGQIAEVDRVRELLLGDLEHRRSRLGLAEEVVADVAVLGDHLSLL